MKRQVFCFCFKHHRYVGLFQARVPPTSIVLSRFSLFHCHFFWYPKTPFSDKPIYSAVKKKHKVPILARQSQGSHSYLKCCYYVITTPFNYINDIPTTSPTVKLMNWTSFVTWGPKGKPQSPWIYRHGFHWQNSGKITSKPLEESWNSPAKVTGNGHRLALWQLWTMFRPFFSK